MASLPLFDSTVLVVMFFLTFGLSLPLSFESSLSSCAVYILLCVRADFDALAADGYVFTAESLLGSFTRCLSALIRVKKLIAVFLSGKRRYSLYDFFRLQNSDADAYWHTRPYIVR